MSSGSSGGRRATAAAVLLLVAGTAFAEEWFDAYDRGLAALKQKKGARAVEMLTRAIEMRPEPGTNLLTYGTNRLDRYYPYLALAEAHLLLGDGTAAREALARSEAKGKEPAAERARLIGLVEAAQKAKAPPPAPPTTIAVAAPPPATIAPATLHQRWHLRRHPHRPPALLRPLHPQARPRRRGLRRRACSICVPNRRGPVSS